jgi:branched-chain amino acid aminotransferase
LPGVTRELVIEGARATGIAIHETALAKEDLEHAEEIFLTSSLRGVQAVTSVDGCPVTAAPGPATLEMRRLYSQFLEGDLDP